MPSTDLVYFMAKDRLFHTEENERTAMICATVANAFRDKKSRPAKPEDFLPRKKAAPMSNEAIGNALKQFAAVHNGRLKGGT